jgi:manganese/zinc/iron transport system substrate-binding protein
VSKSLLALLLLAVVAVGGAGCGQPVGTAAPRDLAGRELRLVATTGMVGDLVSRVAGERARVEVLMGPGIDPHGYKASEGDVLRLAEADAIFYNGLHLEAKMADVLERIQGRIETVAVAETIPRERLRSPPEFEGAYDPHVWFDVALWLHALDEVEASLAALDPAHEGVYRERAAEYREELRALDEEVRRLTASVPPGQRVLVTAHDAFGYFGAAYRFEVRGLQGISTATEAGAGDVQALAEYIAERRIPAIFVESSVPRQTVQAVREAVRSRGFDVVIGAELFSDAMGSPGTPEGAYPGMIRHNVRAIVGALGGETDAR